jgi:dTDP-4-dehydrorhamnose reductase
MVSRAREGKELNVVDDQILTPTYTLDVAVKTAEIVTSQHFGLYHLTNAGQCSWFDFTAEILDQCGLGHVRLNPVKTGFFGEKMMRPAYSVLDNRRLREEGFSEMPLWQDALKRYLCEKGHR